MKKAITLMFLITLTMMSLVSMAQQFSVEGGIGIGNLLESEHRSGKGTISIGGYYHISEKIQIGLEAGTGGDFFPIGEDIQEENGLILLNPVHFNFNTVVFKGRYYFTKIWNTRVYAGLSIGMSKYLRYLKSYGVEKVSERNLIAIPELGITMDRVNISLRYYTKGTTPEFSGRDDIRDVLLPSDWFSLLIIKASYQLTFGK